MPLGDLVGNIDEDAHPLLARSMGIDGAPGLQCTFDVDFIVAGGRALFGYRPCTIRAGVQCSDSGDALVTDRVDRGAIASVSL